MTSNDNDPTNTAEYQQRQRMSRDERSIVARDIVAKNIKEHNEKCGINSTYDAALRKATEIAQKMENKKRRKE